MKRLRADRRGYTVVEVLSAMTLFAIGAAGVISMQRVTIQGGDDARRMDVATNLAHVWTSRLQRDAAFWTDPNDTTLNETVWLKTCPTTGWVNPPATDPDSDPGKSGSFDLYGRDRSSTIHDHMFCAQYRLSWLIDTGGASPIRLSTSMLAEVRVFWARLDNAPIENCADLKVDPNDPAAQTYYHFVYATTAVRPNLISTP